MFAMLNTPWISIIAPVYQPTSCHKLVSASAGKLKTHLTAKLWICCGLCDALWALFPQNPTSLLEQPTSLTDKHQSEGNNGSERRFVNRPSRGGVVYSIFIAKARSQEEWSAWVRPSSVWWWKRRRCVKLLVLCCGGARHTFLVALLQPRIN